MEDLPRESVRFSGKIAGEYDGAFEGAGEVEVADEVEVGVVVPGNGNVDPAPAGAGVFASATAEVEVDGKMLNKCRYFKIYIFIIHIIQKCPASIRQIEPASSLSGWFMEGKTTSPAKA